MKIIITQEQFNLLKETRKEKVSCSKCEHSWKIEKKDKHPYLCHMCGYDSKTKKHNYKELENFKKNNTQEEVTEKWSEKYKKSINCNNPKGFSQRAHCQGRKKHLKESEELDLLKEKGYNLNKIKKSLKILSQISETIGENIPLDFKLYGYELLNLSSGANLVLFIDVDYEGDIYYPTSKIWHQISNQLLDIFEMTGIRDERYMKPYYDFKFNQRRHYNIKKV